MYACGSAPRTHFGAAPARSKNGKVASWSPLPLITAVVSLVGLAGVLTWRVREGRTAVTLKKIVMPPLGMATGFCMFFYPPCRVPFLWGLAAFLIGAVLFAYPLLLTSDLHLQNGVIIDEAVERVFCGHHRARRRALPGARLL